MTTWTCAGCAGENPEATRFCGHCGSPKEAVASPGEASTPVAGPDLATKLRSLVSSQVADRLEESEGLLAEERRLVTAVFADISGFTALAERYDPEELQEVIDPVVAALSDVIAKHGGYVEKYAGDALLALFGAPVSHEDDPQRALTAALELHEELARVRETVPYEHDLGLHVGVNSGHGIARIFGSDARMDYAVLGDAVILAQRLESAAPTGETYVGETTYRLAKGEFDFVGVPDLTVKGKPDPVRVWRLLGKRAPSPSAVGSLGHPRAAKLVGRERELGAALTWLDSLFTVGGGVVAIVGDAGAGKSRLKHELASEVAKREARWMEAHCLTHGAAQTYFPFAQLLRGFAGIDSEFAPPLAAAAVLESLSAVGAADAGPYFLRLLGLPPPDGLSAVELLEPEAYRRGLHEAFASWLACLAAVSPLVIMVEDVHWMDASSRALTHDLLHTAAADKILLLLTARPEGGSFLDEIIGAATPGRTEAIELGPLDDDAVNRFLRSLLDAPPPSRFSALVTERAGGNPFFVEELVRSLRDEGALVPSEQGWQLTRSWEEGTVPLNLEGVLSARIDLLPPVARRNLLEASVIGRRVPVQLLHRLSPDAGDGVATLIEKGFLDPVADTPDELEFHHALVQDAAYSRLLRRQRRTLHRRVAELVEELYGAGDDVIDLLARHSYLGEVGAKAIEFLVRAGDRAARLFANEAAILHLSRGLELARRDPDWSEQRAGLILGLADLYELTGDYDHAFDLYSEAAGLPNDVRAWRGMASVRRRQGRYAEAERIIEAAFANLSEEQNTSLWLERAWTLAVEGRPTETIEAAQAGLVTADPHDPLRPYLLIQLAQAQHSQGNDESALAHSLQAQQLLEDQEDQRGLATALRLTAGIHLHLHDLEEAATVLRKGLEVAERVGNVEELGGCLINLGMVEHQRGNLDDAIECDRRAIAEFERIGHGSGRAIGYSNLSEKLMDRGDLDDALRSSETAYEIAQAIGHTPTIADALQTMATIYVRRGEYATAAARAEQAVEVNLEVGATNYAAEAAEIAAEAWALAGDTIRADLARTRATELNR